MACTDIGSGMWWNGSAYFTDAACTQQITGGLDDLTGQQIQDALDLETPSKKEEADWLKWLQGNQATATNKTGETFFTKYGMYLLAAGVFILFLLMLTYFKKK